MRKATKRTVGLDDGFFASVAQVAIEDTVSDSVKATTEQKLRLGAMADAVAAFETDNGPITEVELDQARRRFGPLR